ncbi:MAG: cysteine desulfurase [Candidatus Micrarchaeota archaeon]|nr:cysteine desulfurase [Candidatus Micrarchaeota archaeon]MCX8202507.1 cysteine desulfurase [Candidatus Micrarchaeota archaeon]
MAKKVSKSGKSLAKIAKPMASEGKIIFMDYASSTPVREEVLEAMQPYFRLKFGNPSSLHSYGREAKLAIEEAKEKIAKTINASPEEIVFTSGSTESSVLAIRGVAKAKMQSGNHILSSAIEHDPVFSTCKSMVTEGFTLTTLLVDVDGLVSIADVRSKITPKTILLSVQHSNGEIGTIQHIEDIGRIAKEKSVTFHTDATFSYGWVPLDVRKMNVDLMSFDAHHCYGPKGIGALYVKSGIPIKPIFPNKDNLLRPGTLSIASIVGFAAAAEIAHKEMGKNQKNLARLQRMFIDYIEENIKFVKLNGHLTRRLPNNINFSFSGITGSELVKQLEENGIITSTCVDCRALEAIGVKGEKFTGSVRFTFGKDTTQDEAKKVAMKVMDLVERARKG